MLKVIYSENNPHATAMTRRRLKHWPVDIEGSGYQLILVTSSQWRVWILSRIEPYRCYIFFYCNGSYYDESYKTIHDGCLAALAEVYALWVFLPLDAMHSAVLVIVNLSVCPSVCLSVTLVDSTHMVRPFFTIWQPHDSSFLAPNFNPHSNGMTFKFKVEY